MNQSIRMKSSIIILRAVLLIGLVGCFLTGTTRTRAATNGLARALQQGLFEEEGNRNFAEAIKAYQAALKLFEEDRKLAATANFRLAECYRKLGNTNDAMAQYQALLRDFSEQSELAGLARQQLLAMGGAPGSATAESTGIRVLDAPSKEEQEEIARIVELIRNSPDLISARNWMTRMTPLHQAAAKGQMQVAQFLLDSGAEVNSRQSDNDQTPLHIAAENGHRAMVELLLSRKADVNARRSDGATPLHLVVRRGFKVVADVLAANKADVEARDNNGQTPLHYAAGSSYGGMVQWLLDHKAPVDARDKDGSTPLLVATTQKQEEAVRLLLERKADPNLSGTARFDDGRIYKSIFPVQMAVIMARDDILKLLLEHGADPNAHPEGQDYLTALFYAVENQHPSAVELLVKAGADPNRQNEKGITFLRTAVARQAQEIMTTLLSGHANPNVKDEQGQTALISAILNKDKRAVEALIAAKAEVEFQDTSGHTPLWFACALGLPEIAETLLNHGADPNAGGSPHSPLAEVQGRMARTPNTSPRPPEYGRFETIAKLLRDHGAVEDLPNFKQIEIRRSAARFSTPVFSRGSNDWNQFTLFELLGVHYGFLSLDKWPHHGSVNSSAYNLISGTLTSSLGFPDLRRVTILRAKEDGRGRTEISVNLEQKLAGPFCQDELLQWGDAVEIPEVDHPVSVAWAGFAPEQLEKLKECLKRTVQITIKGSTTNLTLLPEVLVGGGRDQRKYPQGAPFMIAAVLGKSGLIRASSDLTRVKVTRVRSSGGSQQWVIDCTAAMAQMLVSPYSGMPPDLWLRDGDSIEIPEKQ